MSATIGCPRCGTRYPETRFAACPRCFLEAEVPPALLGDSLELVEEVGRGGMGTVWRARHLRLGRTVAVKFLAADLAGKGDFARRLEREAQALARLSHPGIVGVHDFGRDGDRAYIVMEYVEGRPLSECLPLALDRACDVAAQVADALAYAHAQGVVHRDVKPQNVLLDAAGRAKVSDFGIARLLGPGSTGWTVTTEGRVVGTPAYMAPEALAGAPPDPRMDVFSLGVLLYEMVTAHRPVGDFAALPGPLDGVVRRALSPEPAGRYASVAEMRDALAALPTSEAADLPPDERPWLHAVALLATLATAAGLWALLLSVTPRVLHPGDVMPLIMLRTETLPDGRILSRARFETGPTLGAVAAVVLALAGHGLLRRHWRRSGLERSRPERAVPESRAVLVCGVVAVAVYGLRRQLEAMGITTLSAYVPILGGVIELAALFLAWRATFEAWRTRRPLVRETTLWGGFALALVPPVVDLMAYLASWRP